MAKAETTLVRPDAEIRVRVTCNERGHSRPCEDHVTTAQLLDAHLAVVAYMHGKVSGMDSGVRVRYRLSLVNPERDVIKEG